jgi:hypothetical protein
MLQRMDVLTNLRSSSAALCAAGALGAVACASGTASAPATPRSSELASAALARPQPPSALSKYPAFSTTLSRDPAYLRSAPAPDFWALIPYYVGQHDDVSCSLASLTMVVNAARHTTPLGSNDELVTQPLLRRRVANASWERGLAPDGQGVTLEELARLARESLQAFGLVPERVRVTHVPEASPEALAELRRSLLASETSERDFLLFNFLARTYVGVGDYGHVAPVGAYDASARRVLILDPDRTWYEPYWIPDEVALAGMATDDAVSGRARGYLYVSVCPARGCG